MSNVSMAYYYDLRIKKGQKRPADNEPDGLNSELVRKKCN
jgi:hypothetical protein